MDEFKRLLQKIVHDIETLKQIRAVQDWIAPTLLNSWVNYGSGYNIAGYMKDPNGFVHLRGLIKNGTVTAGTALMTLPAGYRPEYICHAPALVSGGGATVQIRINTSGSVYFGDVNGNATWTCLDSIIFKAYQ